MKTRLVVAGAAVVQTHFPSRSHCRRQRLPPLLPFEPRVWADPPLELPPATSLEPEFD
jgi:hypothetical protein